MLIGDTEKWFKSLPGGQCDKKTFKKNFESLLPRTSVSFVDSFFGIMCKGTNQFFTIKDYLDYQNLVEKNDLVEKSAVIFKSFSNNKKTISKNQFSIFGNLIFKHIGGILAVLDENYQEIIVNIFEKIDRDSKGEINSDEFSLAYTEQSPFFQWLDFFFFQKKFS